MVNIGHLLQKEVKMRNLLSDIDINTMREELDTGQKSERMTQPPKGKEYWSVYRIIATLEYFQDIEKKYNKLICASKIIG